MPERDPQMTTLDRLVAEQAIMRLVIRYAQLVDDGDFHRVVEMFTPDGRLVRPSGGEAVVGRDALLAAFLARPPRVARHVVSNILVELGSCHSATCSSTIMLFTAASGESPPAATRPALLGSFEDRLVHTPDGWRFAERVGAMLMKI